MYSYYIANKITKEIIIIFGYNRKDAFRRARLNEADWEVQSEEYED